jgi:hypothetical protein
VQAVKHRIACNHGNPQRCLLLSRGLHRAPAERAVTEAQPTPSLCGGRRSGGRARPLRTCSADRGLKSTPGGAPPMIGESCCAGARASPRLGGGERRHGSSCPPAADAVRRSYTDHGRQSRETP